MQKMSIQALVVGALVVGMALTGCGGSSSSFQEPVITDQQAASLSLRSEEVVPTAPTYQRDRYDLEAIVYRLRTVIAPLFQHYGLTFGHDFEDSSAFKTMLSEVSFVAKGGIVTVTDIATGGVIFTGQLNNVGSGVFTPANIPGGAPPPTACTYTTGSWGPCQSNGTQTRTVTASPTGCTGTPPASSQACTYVPPPSAGTCTGFTYSAWAPSTCPASGQQTRTVLLSTPAGCTGGSPVLTQTCTPAPVTCTSFTYSTWAPATCPANGQQTRTVATSSPAGCTGGTPVLTQTCTPPVTNPVTAANIVSSCTGCHGLKAQNTVFRTGGYSKTANSNAWLTTVNNMVNLGATLTNGTAQNYADFLAAQP